MKLKKEYWKGILGVALIILAIAGIFYWENGGRQALTYANVLVMRQDVPSGTEIKQELLGFMKMDRSQLIDGIVKSPDEIVGKRTSTYIPKGLQLSEEFFEDPGLATGKGNYIFAVPKEWIYSYPQTIRRGDKVFFYAVYGGGETESLDGDALPEMETSNQALIETTVAYVKDSANREVVDVTPKRMDASAQTASIEVVMDNERYEAIKGLAESGCQFILMYE